MLLPSSKAHHTSVINVTSSRPKCPFEYVMSIVVLKDIRGSERLQDDLSKPLHFLTSRKKPHWDTRPHVRPCSSAERSQRSRVLIQGQLPKRRAKIQSGDPHFRTSFSIGLVLQSGDSLDEILDSRNKETVSLNSAIHRSTVPNKTKPTWAPITEWRFGNQEYRIRILTDRGFDELELQQLRNSFFPSRACNFLECDRDDGLEVAHPP